MHGWVWVCLPPWVYLPNTTPMQRRWQGRWWGELWRSSALGLGPSTLDVGGRHGSVASRDAGAARVEYDPDGNVRGGSGSGEISPVKAILCQFALQSLVVACPYTLPAIFKCTLGEELVYKIRHHQNLILHGKLSTQDHIYMLIIESTSSVTRQNYIIFECTGGGNWYIRIYTLSPIFDITWKVKHVNLNLCA